MTGNNRMPNTVTGTPRDTGTMATERPARADRN
jgi:hypothetical protein